MPDEPLPPARVGGPGTTVAIVLAAGAGSRFGGDAHKLTALVDGRSVAERAVGAAVDAGIGPVVVVTGAVDPLAASPLRSRVTVVHHEAWADGQATSLRAGLDAARDLGASAVVVGLADQPGIAPEAWCRVAASMSPIAVATYGDRPRNPVRFGAEVWELLPTSGDEGARSLVRLRPDLVERVPCPGSPDDIDTLEDLATWQSRSSTNSR